MHIFSQLKVVSLHRNRLSLVLLEVWQTETFNNVALIENPSVSAGIVFYSVLFSALG